MFIFSKIIFFVFNFAKKIFKKRIINRQILSQFPFFNGTFYGFEKPLNNSYFLRFYRLTEIYDEKKFIFTSYLLQKFFSYEVLDISKINKSTPKTFTVKADCLVAIGSTSKKIQKLEIINNDVTENINVYPGRFYYQKLFKGKYTIKSQKDFLVSKEKFLNDRNEEIA